MTYHRRHEQDNDQSRQQPRRTNDERRRQRQINSADSQKCQKHLPTRLRFIDVIMLVRHESGIAGIGRGANTVYGLERRKNSAAVADRSAFAKESGFKNLVPIRS